MKRSFIIVFCVILPTFFSFSPASAQTGPIPGIDQPYWQQNADYMIKCLLEHGSHRLTGAEQIRYTNNSPDTLTDFYLHLYPNAYKDKDSQLLKDFLAGVWFQVIGLPEKNRGWIEIDSFAINGRPDSFTVDGTILKTRLRDPLPPGGTLTVDLSFTEKIRERLGRAGYIGTHYDMGQWYPKVVVYDKDGWHPDQFRNGEFYGEFGTYDVHLTLPEEFVIAATGVPVSGDPGWEKNSRSDDITRDSRLKMPGKFKTVHFRAEDVHDFAWCADPSFIVEKTSAGGADIISFYRPWNADWADSALARGVRAIKWMERFAGPYGYPQMSIVDSNSRGGMEYPMLVMNGSADEGLIFHEIGHNWFYAMLANNERDEGWIDEGMTVYQTYLYEESEYGPYGKGSRKGLSGFLSPRRKLWEEVAASVIDYHRRGFAERVSTPYHEFKSSGRAMVYTKGALFIRALRYYVGDEDFWKIMRTYFDRWKFKHVDEETFLSVCEEISQTDLDEFFKQWLHTTKSCDYRIDRFKVNKAVDAYTADVRIKRKGEMMMPLQLTFRLKNGNTVSERIDGIARSTEKQFILPVEPVSVSIVPGNEILDIYPIDNHSPRKRDLALDNPLSSYYPPDAYQYRIAPLGYYNDIDGGKAGLRIRGSYDDRYNRFTLQGLYGFESEAVDVYGSYDTPFGYLGREAFIGADAYLREGRQGGSLAIYKTRRNHLTDPLAKHYTLKLTYQEMTDPEYIIPGSYEEGKNLKASLFIASYPRTDIVASSFLLGLERSTWGSDHNYEKLSFDMRLWPSRHWPVSIWPKTRLFYGRVSIDPPVQELFNLAGAGSPDKDDYFWLRSKGAFWEDRYNNFHVPGDANLRGYFNGDFGFRSIFSSNTEVDFPLFLPVGRGLRSKAGARIFLFYDIGKVIGSDPFGSLPGQLAENLDSGQFDHFLQDFGFGVKIWKLQANFPLYLSDPELAGDDEKWDFRWTVGFGGLF